jgi:hypothetical protein
MEELSSREHSFGLFKHFFSEILSELSKHRNFDLVKWINFKILEQYPPLFDYLSVKHARSLLNHGDQDSSKYIERIVTILQEDTEINYEVLQLE